MLVDLLLFGCNLVDFVLDSGQGKYKNNYHHSVSFSLCFDASNLPKIIKVSTEYISKYYGSDFAVLSKDEQHIICILFEKTIFKQF